MMNESTSYRNVLPIFNCEKFLKDQIGNITLNPILGIVSEYGRKIDDEWILFNCDEVENIELLNESARENIFRELMKLTRDNPIDDLTSLKNDLDAKCSVCNDGSLVFMKYDLACDSVIFWYMNTEVQMKNYINSDKISTLIEVLTEMINIKM